MCNAAQEYLDSARRGGEVGRTAGVPFKFLFYLHKEQADSVDEVVESGSTDEGPLRLRKWLVMYTASQLYGGMYTAVYSAMRIVCHSWCPFILSSVLKTTFCSSLHHPGLAMQECSSETPLDSLSIA